MQNRAHIGQQPIALRIEAREYRAAQVDELFTQRRRRQRRVRRMQRMSTRVAIRIIGVALYKLLKQTLVRERPFITHSGISLHGAPLDRYSFPSGHTLHAVAFTWQAVGHFPQLGWVLVPFATLVAASRVVLGLHYPTDVLVGAAIGGLLGSLGLALG